MNVSDSVTPVKSKPKRVAGPRSICRKGLPVLRIGLALFFGAVTVSTEAQNADTTESKQTSPEVFEKRSIALRTALHYDPSLEIPTAELLKLYRGDGRADELVGLYRSHIRQYPKDPGGRIVLARILHALGRSDARDIAAKAAKDLPDDALVAYVHAQILAGVGGRGAIEEFARAVELTKRHERRLRWTRELIDQALEAGRSDLAKKQLEALAEDTQIAPDRRISLARKMLDASLPDMACSTLESILSGQLPPEVAIDAELALGEALAAADRTDEAAARLDALLDRVTLEFWRRSEILSLRVGLIKGREERQAMLAVAAEEWAANPRSEGAALQLAELQNAFGLRREAADTLTKTASQLPESDRVEKALLDILDRLSAHDEAADFLVARLDRRPGRSDLLYRLVQSLFLAGRREEAHKSVTPMMESIPEADRSDRMLELARFLKRMSLAHDATDIYESVIEAEPERLDVRQELATTLIALGNRAAAQRVLDGAIAFGAAEEDLTEIVQFFIAQEMHTQARKALETRLETLDEGTGFGLQLLLVELYGRTGDQKQGSELLDALRADADTLPRYRQWLQTGVQFWDSLGGVTPFIAGEQNRLREEAKTEENGLTGSSKAELTQGAGRTLALSDIAGVALNDENKLLESILRERLKSLDPSDPGAVEIRTMLVQILEGDKERTVELEKELKTLLEAAPDLAPENRIRLAKLYNTSGRTDLLRETLDVVDFSLVMAPELVADAKPLLVTIGHQQKLTEAIRRAIELEPNGLNHWEDLIQQYALDSDEDSMRTSLRQLLLGASGQPLTGETKTLVQNHLGASCWRSIARILSQSSRNDGKLSGVRGAEIGRLAGLAEEVGGSAERTLWAPWARAYAAVLTGQDDIAGRERDQFLLGVEEMLLLKQSNENPKAEPKPIELDHDRIRIAFPDGITATLASALNLLEKQAPKPEETPEAVSPISGEMEVRWAFRTRFNSPVSFIEPIRDLNVVIIGNAAGDLYGISDLTGKLVWQTKENGAAHNSSNALRAPIPTIPGQTNVNNDSRISDLAPDVKIVGQQIFRIRRNRLECLSATNGTLIWDALIPPPAPPKQSAAPSYGYSYQHTSGQGQDFYRIATGDGFVFLLDPSRSRVSAHKEGSGKLAWETDLGAQGQDPPTISGQQKWSTGISYSEGRVFGYAGAAGLLDAKTGAPLWSFDSRRVQVLPISLEAESDDPALVSKQPKAPGNPKSNTLLGLSSTLSSRVSSGYGLSSTAAIIDYSLGKPRQQFRQSPRSYRYGSTQPSGLSARLRLAASVPTWVTQSHSGKRAILSGDVLLLQSPSAVSKMVTNFPIAPSGNFVNQPAAMNLQGVLVGHAAGRVILQNNTSLIALDVDLGRPPLTIHISGNSTFSRTYYPRVALGGPLAYVADDRSMRVFHMGTGQRIAQQQFDDTTVRWLDSLNPKIKPPRKKKKPALPTFSSSSSYRTPAQPPINPAEVRATFAPYGVIPRIPQLELRGVSAPIVPVVGAVEGQNLYLPVALEAVAAFGLKGE